MVHFSFKDENALLHLATKEHMHDSSYFPTSKEWSRAAICFLLCVKVWLFFYNSQGDTKNSYIVMFCSFANTVHNIAFHRNKDN